MSWRREKGMFAFLKYFAVILEGPLQTPFTGLTGPVAFEKSTVKSIIISSEKTVFIRE
jgi:hypothetical protein